MKKAVVLVLHGIGSYHSDFPDAERRFDYELRTRVEARLGSEFDSLLWVPVLWSDATLEARQEALIARRNPRQWKRLFQFVASGLGDASAHALPQNDDDYWDSSYFRTQNLIRRILQQAEKDFDGDAATVPVFAIAHSMGCRVLAGYAWDAALVPKRILDRDERAANLTPLQRLDNLAGLVFTGCNIPLLTMDIDNEAMMPMRLPLRPLPARPDFESVWLNYYDRSDVLGYAIEPEFAAYYGGRHRHQHCFAKWGRDPDREQRPTDLPVVLGHWLAWSPYAHQAYDRSNKIVGRIADELKRLLAAL